MVAKIPRQEQTTKSPSSGTTTTSISSASTKSPDGTTDPGTLGSLITTSTFSTSLATPVSSGSTIDATTPFPVNGASPTINSEARDTATIIGATPSGLTSTPSATEAAQSASSSGPPIGGIVGGVIGGILGLALLGTLWLCCRRQQQRKRMESHTRARSYLPNNPLTEMHEIQEQPSRSSPRAADTVDPYPPPITIDTIMAALPTKSRPIPPSTLPVLPYRSGLKTSHAAQASPPSSEGDSTPTSSSNLQRRLSEVREQFDLIQRRRAELETTTPTESSEMMDLIRGLQLQMQRLEAQMSLASSGSDTTQRTFPAFVGGGASIQDEPPDYSSTIASVYNLRDHR
ncbi:hypothetical protein DL96DRAFT_1676946 [Flagelloscypha sp. PMI_526]|nr:hypothetical protein DL96DRAFT_1676946 [Flagelloscypha sp. PMI_526]